jgi:acetylglutamate kinase
VNSDLVTLAQNLGVRAVGISGKDGRLMTVDKAMPDGKDIGYVGTVREVDAKIIYNLLDDDFLPIIYPIGIGDDGQSYNVNGDSAAEAIAEALKADKLAFLTDTSGVYEDINDEDSFVSELYTDEAEKMIEDGIITGGMIPKVKNCLKAIAGGVNRVHILDGRIPHCLLLEIFTDRGCGTAIMNHEEQRYYNK